jgi:hypothetical protein
MERILQLLLSLRVTEGNAAISTGKLGNWLTKLIGRSEDWHIVFKLVNWQIGQ